MLVDFKTQCVQKTLSSGYMMGNFDVLIVGAGASGLMAGYTLAHAGHSVLIVEARDRIGGRIYTIKPPNFSTKIEAGAEFVHGDLPLTKQLIEAAGSTLLKVDGKYYRFSKTIREENFFDESWSDFMKKLQAVTVDITLHDFLQQNFAGQQDLYDRVKKYAEGYNAADIRLASCLALKEEWSESEDAPQYRPSGGYSVLIEYLSAQLSKLNSKFELNSVVKKVEWNSDTIKAVTNDRHFIARKILVTIPVSLIPLIEFQPSIPVHQAAESIGFGSVMKCIIEFEEDLFSRMIKKVPVLFFMFSDQPIPTWWTQTYESRPQLTGWLGGPDAGTLCIDTGQTRLLAIKSLSEIFGMSVSDVEEGIKGFYSHNWANDEFSKGAYSYSTLSTEQAKRKLSEPIDNVIFFAGEALYSGADSGTVEAALASGQQAAKEISKRLASDRTVHA